MKPFGLPAPKRVFAGNRLYCKHWLKTIDLTKRVYVYRNLHNNCWSVKQSGKVVDHTHFLLLSNCRYLVGEAGRERVRREKKKNVHAGISGYVAESVPDKDWWDWAEISYNPYVNESFMGKDGYSFFDEYWYFPIYNSNYCIIDNKKVEAINMNCDFLSRYH